MTAQEALMHKFCSAVVLFLLSVLLFFLYPYNASAVRAASADGKTVIVLDPGHGGPLQTSDNQGAQYAPYSEKVLTLQLAQLIQKELSSYDNVEVFLTRTTDTSMSLADRAAYAKYVGADFLISLHYNASGSHLFYGTEVETSSAGTYYSQGTSFGRTVLSQTAQLGLYSKGTKTRIGQHGDYYGIIRDAAGCGIPAVIIEHCYLDSSPDRTIFAGKGVAALAHADATAIAAYFHLKSASTGVDFSSYARFPVAVPVVPVRDDTTPPDVCQLVMLSRDAAGNATFRLTAEDTDTIYPVLYYSYSVNGTPSALLPYNQAAGPLTFTVKAPAGSSVYAIAYNSYDKYSTRSNTVTVQ